jgi:hypothetical protein
VTRVVVLRYAAQPGILARLELPGEGDVAVGSNSDGEFQTSTSSSFVQEATSFTPRHPLSLLIPFFSPPSRPALHLDTKRPGRLPPFAPFPPWPLPLLSHKESPISETRILKITNRYSVAIAPLHQ